MVRSTTGLHQRDERIPPDPIIFGYTPAMAALRRSLHKVADTSIPILIEGESGTGKEIICRYLHRHSVWGRGPFVKVNCPAIAGTLLESELFGYERGALAGALGPQTGRMDPAPGGTLFLDEIYDLDLALQSKLLQALQVGQFPGIGVNGEKMANVRIVCSTNRELQPEIALERFRQDLYYRISGLVLRLPPLRERLEDLPALANYFVAVYNEQFHCRALPVSGSSLELMSHHRWTGNIRELENLIKRYVVLGTEDAILSAIGDSGFMPAEPVPPAVSLSELTRAALHEMEGKIIFNALRAHQWNRKRTAHALKISYRSLLYKLKKAGIENRREPEPLRTEPINLRNLQ